MLPEKKIQGELARREMSRFKQYKALDLPAIGQEVLEKWKREKTFQQSVSKRKDSPTFVFYEGPPSANGLPGIHHVLPRTIKDIFCRYKTMQGYQVRRKAGWDTHGLPVELGVEKKLNITKSDIGETISVEQYNRTCREEVMKYQKAWEDLTDQMGYWVDMSDPYITYESKYIETLWYLLKTLYDKKYLYKGHSIQPYSPAAGTALSTHELNLPGCYREVKDTTAVAMFRAVEDENSRSLMEWAGLPLYFLAWTTTPWTLLSNTALAVGKNISYALVKTVNPYSGEPVAVILAQPLLGKYFTEDFLNKPLSEFNIGDKNLPYEVIREVQGYELEGLRYEQLFPFSQPKEGDAFCILYGDFVTTEEGTGIVHIAPSFGADDYLVAKQNGIGALTLVDREGKFTEETQEFAGRYVKNAFDQSLPPDTPSVDVDIVVSLKHKGQLFRTEKYSHSYPHCWRTDKPILYYPTDAWFIRTTAVKERMKELNNTINWKPPTIGTGRFGRWIENLVDWNLSRSRFWGTPLPIWATEDYSEIKCIGSVVELKEEIEQAVAAGIMEKNPFSEFVPHDFSSENYKSIDLHRPYVDEIFLLSSKGEKMTREKDLIDVWFDSGAMPFAQLHYPFENSSLFDNLFPADFIAEGVDQTRGWFFTLHAIATMVKDNLAFKNIISNGLVLDSKGDKMSKRLGNSIDPFTGIKEYGADVVRWYMITTSQPWDNLKFDHTGLDEVRRKFFGTLYNTYSFFALYSSIDDFSYEEKLIAYEERPELDRWVLSKLHLLTKQVEAYYQEYEPTRAARAISEFVVEHLSNWFVRLSRKRYWGGTMNSDKLSAYQTLYEALLTVSQLAAPIAPFYTDKLYSDLTKDQNSVHLSTFPKARDEWIDRQLIKRMELAQRLCSMVLGLRRKKGLKVRQPLRKILVPILSEERANQIKQVEAIILNEVNVKEMDLITDTQGITQKRIKARFKELGPRYGKQMKEVASAIASMSASDISTLEQEGSFAISPTLTISLGDVEITTEDIPGWLVAQDGDLTVALDVSLSEDLIHEGTARELVNRIQNVRKELGFNVTDKIDLTLAPHDHISLAVEKFRDYISSQTLAQKLSIAPINGTVHTIDLNGTLLSITIKKIETL